MKKYIVLIVLLSIFTWFSYAKDYPGTRTGCTDICLWSPYSPKTNWCTSKCCESPKVLLPGSGNEQICCAAWEQLNPNWKCTAACVGGEFYGRGWLLAGNTKCCPAWWIRYEKDSVTNNFAKCCEWKIYSKTSNDPKAEDSWLSCCKNWSAVVKNSKWEYSCISCSTLKQEIQIFGPTWPYTVEQQDKIAAYPLLCSDKSTTCADDKKYTDEWWASQCCDGIVEAGKCITNNAWNMWIDINQQCLINWQCKFDIYQTLGIRQSLPRETRSSPWIFIQDIILSATFFVGTLITWVLIISWLLFVFAGAKPDLQSKAKKWVTWSLIWLLFVVWSYAFVRLIQFLVTWGGW